MDTSHKIGSDERSEGARPARRMPTLEERRRIVAEAMQPGVSIAAVARQHGVNAGVLFGWCRLQCRGLLDPTALAPAFLPVKIAEPTPSPMQRSVPTSKSTSRAATRSVIASGSVVEGFVSDQVRIPLDGGAQREVPERLLAWLPAR